MRTSSTRRLGVISIAALFALVFSFATPALATGKGHTSKSSGTTVTEDNDNNDGGTPNNVADAGDNRHPSGKDRSVENGGSGNQGKSTSDPDGMENGGPDKPGGSGGVDKADQDGNNGCGNDDDFEDDNNGNCGGHHKGTGGTEECAKAGQMSDHGKSKGNGQAASTKDCGEVDHTGECPKAASMGSDDHGKDCDHAEDTAVEGTATTKCPKAGEAPKAGETMPAGCVIGTPVTASAPGGSVLPVLPNLSTATTPAGVLAGAFANTPAADNASVLGLELERAPQAAAAGGTAPAGASVLGASVTRGAALARTGFGLTMMALALALVLLGVGFLLKRAGRSTSDF